MRECRGIEMEGVGVRGRGNVGRPREGKWNGSGRD